MLAPIPHHSCTRIKPEIEKQMFCQCNQSFCCCISVLLHETTFENEWITFCDEINKIKQQILCTCTYYDFSVTNPGFLVPGCARHMVFVIIINPFRFVFNCCPHEWWWNPWNLTVLLSIQHSIRRISNAKHFIPEHFLCCINCADLNRCLAANSIIVKQVTHTEACCHFY